MYTNIFEGTSSIPCTETLWDQQETFGDNVEFMTLGSCFNPIRPDLGHFAVMENRTALYPILLRY